MVDVVIPVYRPDEKFYKLIERLSRQTVLPANIIVMYTVYQNAEEEIKVLCDKMTEIVKKYAGDSISLLVRTIEKKDFNHGKTRNIGVNMGSSPYVLLMTEDAIPSDTHLLEKLMNVLEMNSSISQVYARQAVDSQAPEYLRLTQNFNYPQERIYKTKDDYERLGIKTIFCSDVCCMYRRDIFEYIGGFEEVNFNEDMIFARRAIDGGYTVCYEGNASVIHYHKYTLKQQYRRNYDNAYSQAKHPEIFADLSATKEGKKLVKTVLKELLKKGHIGQFFYYIALSAAKYLGFRKGKKRGK